MYPLLDAQYPVTDVYGSPRPGGRTHIGIDLGTPYGTIVRAPGHGTVTSVWRNELGGLQLRFRLGDRDLEIGLAHLHDCVNQWTELQPGDFLASTGSSGTRQDGSSYSPHLHLTTRVSGKPVDPLSIEGLLYQEETS